MMTDSQHMIYKVMLLKGNSAMIEIQLILTMHDTKICRRPGSKRTSMIFLICFVQKRYFGLQMIVLDT